MDEYEGKRPPGSPRLRWEGDIKMEIELLWRTLPGLTWSGHEQVTATCGHGHEASGAIKCEEFLDYVRNY